MLYQMQSSLDKANKAAEDKDATITSLHQQLGEAEDKWVSIDTIGDHGTCDTCDVTVVVYRRMNLRQLMKMILDNT